MMNTKRAVAIFLEVVDRQLSSLMKLNTQRLFKKQFTEEEVESALKDEQMEREIAKQFAQGNIKLVHKDSGKLAFVKETNILQEHGKTALETLDESIDYEQSVDPEDAKLVSAYGFNDLGYRITSRKVTNGEAA